METKLEAAHYVMRKNGRKNLVRENRDRFFYPEEWLKFREQLKSSQVITFEFLINTGARINEARNVRVGDIDLKNKRLILRVTKVRSKKKEKNPRPRTIPISQEFAKKLKRHITFNKLGNDDYLGIMSTSGANLAMKKALNRAGIKDYHMFSIHNIRKTLETWLMSLGIDGFKIIAHIGHSFQVAAGSYISADVFSWEEKKIIRTIIGGLYGR